MAITTKPRTTARQREFMALAIERGRILPFNVNRKYRETLGTLCVKGWLVEHGGVFFPTDEGRETMAALAKPSLSEAQRMVLEAASRDELWCDVEPRTGRESWHIWDMSTDHTQAIAWQTPTSLLRATPPLIETYTPEALQNCKRARLTEAGRTAIGHD